MQQTTASVHALPTMVLNKTREGSFLKWPKRILGLKIHFRFPRLRIPFGMLNCTVRVNFLPETAVIEFFKYSIASLFLDLFNNSPPYAKGRRGGGAILEKNLSELFINRTETTIDFPLMHILC